MYKHEHILKIANIVFFLYDIQIPFLECPKCLEYGV